MNFAKNATPNNRKEISPIWPEYDPVHQRQLVIQPELVIESFPGHMLDHTSRCEFWNGVNLRN